ncbi:LIC_10190 family membrane protein [Chryseobacterium flavum]|uniref:LIC_10190 family membrane protein n=1 Tax=Chryseobacterium flavum TaxID=415851 RepID=UPI002FDB7482
MILILISAIFIIPVLMGIGRIVELVAGNLFPGIAGKTLSGILGICIIWNIISFFTPLNIYIEIITIILGVSFFVKDKLFREFRQFSTGEILLLTFVSFIILWAGSYAPYILDHFGYYVPTIKWLTEYGLIKGISNLDLTLGQMSVWHIFQAGFSNFSDPFLRINTILLIIYALYIVEKKNWIHLCFIPVMLLYSQSPSPDLPVIMFSLIVLNEIITGNKNIILLFAFSIFTFTIKPTMIWLPILVLSHSILILKSNFQKLILGFSILILFFIKNLWVFGYPVFPIAIGDLGISWKPNEEVLKYSSQYALQKTYDMQYSYEEIQKFSTSDAIKNWFFLKGIKSEINILFIISLFIFSISAWLKKKKLITLISISILIKSILVLIFSAQYRFFIDVFFVIFLVLFYEYFNKRKSIAVFSVLSLLFITVLSFPSLLQQYFPSFKSGNFISGVKKEQFYRPSTYEYCQFKSFRVGNLKFNISKNYPFNFDTPLPSVSVGYILDDAKTGIFPQLSDKNNIRKGFIWKKMDSLEKKEAESIINIIESTYK